MTRASALRGASLALVLLAMVAPRSVRADVSSAAQGCEEHCSVQRSCSSTGMACEPNDRECTGRAAAAGLEIKCDQRCDAGARFVYCPPDTGRGDSGYVWVLLSLAMLLAVGGTTFAWILLRKKP